MRKPEFFLYEYTVAAQLIIAFVFAIGIVQYLFYCHLKFQAGMLYMFGNLEDCFLCLPLQNFLRSETYMSHVCGLSVSDLLNLYVSCWVFICK